MVSAIVLWGATLLYGGAAIAFWMEGKPAWACAYVCYAVANVAMIAASR